MKSLPYFNFPQEESPPPSKRKCAKNPYAKTIENLDYDFPDKSLDEEFALATAETERKFAQAASETKNQRNTTITTTTNHDIIKMTIEITVADTAVKGVAEDEVMTGAQTTEETNTIDEDALKLSTHSTLADAQVKIIADNEAKGGAKTTGEVAEDYFCSASKSNVDNNSTSEAVHI